MCCTQRPPISYHALGIPTHTQLNKCVYHTWRLVYTARARGSCCGGICVKRNNCAHFPAFLTIQNTNKHKIRLRQICTYAHIQSPLLLSTHRQHPAGWAIWRPVFLALCRRGLTPAPPWQRPVVALAAGAVRVVRPCSAVCVAPRGAALRVPLRGYGGWVVKL